MSSAIEPKGGVDATEGHFVTVGEKRPASSSDNGEVATKHHLDNDSAADSLYIDPAEERKLLLRLDLVLGPLVGLLYFTAFLDRGNIGNAATTTLLSDLHLDANAYSLAVSIFYASYVLLETPFATMLKRLRPSRMIPAVIVCWGFVVMGTFWVQNEAGLVATRVILGAFEAALFPCLTVYLTFFYKRTELGQRLCYLFVAAALSSGFGSLLAAALLKMDGILGYAGWRWLYLIEGIATIVIGLASPVFLVDDYSRAWYLSARQKELCAIRQRQDTIFNASSKAFDKREVVKALKDPIVYVSGICQHLADVGLYSISTFLPVIVKQIGSFTPIVANLVAAPVYIWSAIAYMTCAVLSDRIQFKLAFMVPSAVVSLVGFIILLTVHDSVGGQLFACFLCGTGIYTCVGLNLTLLNANQAGVQKRSTAFGLQQTLGNTAGIVAGQIFRSNQSPRYTLGYSYNIGCFALLIILYGVQYVMITRRNAAKDRLTAEQRAAQDTNGITGDARWDFRYTL